MTYYVNVSNTAPVFPYTNWVKAATNIQTAIDTATDGDLILVTNGVYATGGRVVYGALTNRVVVDKAITVQSVNGPAVTLITGYQIPASSTAYTNNVRCVYLTNNAVLDGFTVANGATLALGTETNQLSGGGVFCESTNAMLTNCWLTGNLCLSQYNFGSGTGGGAIYQGLLNNCVISNNMVSTNRLSDSVPGGGAFQSVLNNCLIVSNLSKFGGGAASSTLNHCTVIGNIVDGGSTTWGGGIYQCSASFCYIAGNIALSRAGGHGGGACLGVLNNCVLSNNFAVKGGGCYLQQYSGDFQMMNNCLVVSNTAGIGGGVYNSGGASSVNVTNCTIVGNTATNQAGGIYFGVWEKSIVFGNYCTSVANSSSSNSYSAKLTNCWSSDPLFRNPAAGDFRLSSNSPCINAGNSAFGIGTNDLDGNPRVVGGAVDIGAYEFQTPASVFSYAWAQQYGLPNDGTADYVDSDSDGMNNWQEWRAGTNPTNAASALNLISPTNSLSGNKVTWQSVSGVTYYLQRGTNLAAQPPFTSLVSNLVGQAVLTSYTDATATNATPYFYRVGVQ